MRVFFALWPDPPLRARLAAAASSLHALLGGRAMRPESLHLTLVFVGDVAEERQTELCAAAADVRSDRFEVLFDQLQCWSHNRIANLGASQTPEGLIDLVRRLEDRLDAIDVAFDRRAYVPHITLVRKADCRKKNPAPEAVAWPARDFVLVKSSLRPEGARYEELGRWPLL